MSRLGFENTRALRDLQGSRGVGPLYLTWQSNTYACIPGNSELGKLLGAGGFSPDVDKTFLVAREDFGDTLPAAPQSLSVDGTLYKITRVTVSADAAYVALGVQDKSAGA